MGCAHATDDRGRRRGGPVNVARAQATGRREGKGEGVRWRAGEVARWERAKFEDFKKSGKLDVDN